MLRGISGRALSSGKPRAVAYRRLSTQHGTAARSASRADYALVVASSAIAAGVLWYATARIVVVYNDAPPPETLETKAIDVSDKVALEDDELSVLVWGSNRYANGLVSLRSCAHVC